MTAKKDYKLTGNYGCFIITKMVQARTIEEAWEVANIKEILEYDGWVFLPTGNAQWTVEEVPS